MASLDQNKALRIAMIVVGLTFVFGLYPLTVLWPDGFMWEPRQQEYEQQPGETPR